MNNDKSELEKQIKVATNKFVETSSPAVQRALEQKIEELELRRVELVQSIHISSEPKVEFGTALSKVIEFIDNPREAWVKGDIRKKKLVQKLVFMGPIIIDTKDAIGTANLSLIFNMLGEECTIKKQLVEAAGT